METLLLILNILSLIGIGVIAIFGRKYLESYSSEKAKNLATKEDVEEITDRIESVKKNYALSLESHKAELLVESSLREVFKARSLDALIAINDLLVEIQLYCWKEMAARLPNEHYVWPSVDDIPDNHHFHYYRVALDKINLEHSLFLTQEAQDALYQLSESIGAYSSMELALSHPEPHPDVVSSALQTYQDALKAVKKCQAALLNQLGITKESETGS